MAKNCLTCKSKACRSHNADCFGVAEFSREVYSREETIDMLRNASRLVDGGRAGTLSRFQEVVEFCKEQGYKAVGLAYCFGLEELALIISDIMTEAGVPIVPARCSMGGIKESEVDPAKTSEVVSCNPAGQAKFLNERADFVIEFGLCLGHDVLFHQELEVPHTVLLVKDRVYGHAPLEGIRNYAKDQAELEKEKN